MVMTSNVGVTLAAMALIPHTPRELVVVVVVLVVVAVDVGAVGDALLPPHHSQHPSHQLQEADMEERHDDEA